MSEEQNKSDELDNYGVWVKKPPRDIPSEADESSTDFTVSEDELPDFSDLDAALSDISAGETAQEEDPFADFNFGDTQEEPQQDDGDTALTADELSNIAGTTEMTEAEAPVYEDIDDDFNLSEINADDGEAFLPEATRNQPKYEYEGENPIMPEKSENQETVSQEETSIDDFDLDAFDFEDTPSETEETAEVTDTAAEEPAVEEDFNIDEMFDEISTNTTEAVEEPSFEEVSVEDTVTEPVIEETAVEEPAVEETVDAGDEFNMDATVDASDEFLSDSSSSLDSHEDGEISLDEFFSDDASSSGTTDATAEFADGDLDLDDFLGDSSSSSSSSQQTEIVDEQAMDIDVSFTDDAAEITKAAEEEEKLHEAETAQKAATAAVQAASTEDVGLDEFDADAMFDDLNPAIASSTETNSVSTDDEEIDLSEFGIIDDDSNIGMTKSSENEVPQKKEVVNYDMKVSVEDDNNNVSVSDVVNGNIDTDISETSEEETVQETHPETTEPQGNTGISAEGAAILQQIVGELASLKDEIKNLKSDFETIKTTGVPQSAPAAESTEGGFFTDEDGDDTIALSGSELDNILNNAEFSTVEESQPQVSEDIEVTDSDEPVIEETAVEEPAVEDTVVEETSANDDIFGTEEVSVDDDLTMDFENENLTEPEIDSTEVTPDDLTADAVQEFEIDDELPEEISIPKSDDILVESSSSNLMDSVVNTDEESAEPAVEEPSTVDESAIDEFLADDISIEDSLTEDKMDYLSDESEISNIADISEIMSDNSTSPTTEEDNVAVSVNDDIDAAFAEAEAEESDIFDDAIKEQENISTSEIEDAVESIEANTLQSLNLPVTENETGADMGITEETVDISDFSDEPVIEDTLDEPVIEEPQAEEPVIEEDITEEPVMEEPAVEETLEEPVIEETKVEEPVMPITESEGTADNTARSIPQDLKSEIISVLSYMDQLLENLPDDKIDEFARSEHFVTYKKLFDELGLS